MTCIVDLFAFEEGYSAKPYYDSEGYPTAGIGILLGPKGTPLSNYTFTVPRPVADLWTQCIVDGIMHDIDTNPKYMEVKAALIRCVSPVGGFPLTSTTPYYTSPRASAVLSMAYQMGLDGLAKFHNTLLLIGRGDFDNGAANALQSAWAKQTPKRAARHAVMIRDNTWPKEY